MTSGRIPASSQASSALSTASFDAGEERLAWIVEAQQMAVLVKNSETEISRWRAPISAADSGRLRRGSLGV